MTPQQKAAAVSAAVLALATPVVVKYEGEIRHGYRDPIGIVTACVGHTATAELGRAYTAAECRDLLARDLEAHNAGVLACVQTPMPPHVHAAALSFAFNVGVAKFCGSTMASLLNAGRWDEACAQLSRWTMAGGRVLPGLVKRREAERRLCEGET